MLNKPMDILEQFPIRKTKQQKLAFREAVVAYAREKGYAVTVEAGKRGVNNIVIGDPEKAKYLVTAHYDTPASIGLPNFITPNNPVTYFLIQFFLVGILLAISVGAAWGVYLLTGVDELMLLSWYIVYFGLLLLMLMGPANRSNANDNTSGVVTVLEIMTTMPENLRDRVCFVLFDLEEQGKKGSNAYRKAHQAATETQIVLNLDCVGDGDHLLLMPEKTARQDEALLQRLTRLEDTYGSKHVRVIARGYCRYESDHRNFPYGVGIAAFHKNRKLYLLGKIHTKRDTVLEYTNVNLLRAAIISLISQHN